MFCDPNTFYQGEIHELLITAFCLWNFFKKVTCVSQLTTASDKNLMQRVLGEGLLVVRKIENVATGPNNRPKLPCVTAECGEM